MKELRKFGFRFALALNILGAIMFYREKNHFIWFTGIGSLNLILAVLYPMVLLPIKKLLDNVILLIGWVFNITSLIIVFYLMFTPIGLLLKLFRKDLLCQRIDKDVSSYWIKRRKDIFSKESYRHMG